MADWIGIDGSHLHSLCGEATPGGELDEALDGDEGHPWIHYTNHVHWFILDLGDSYNITQVRGRSNTFDDPKDVDIYVSDDVENFGDAVVEEISTFRNRANWSTVEVTPKVGRYIKVNILDTEDGSRVIGWGFEGPLYTIFDVYGAVPVDVEISGSLSATSSLSGNMIATVVPPIDDRPPTYDPDASWDEDTGAWVSLEVYGGDIYKINLVIIGQDDNGNGVIYYG